MSNELIPIRLSHMLAHGGVGAIVRGPKGLVVVHDTRQWTDRDGIPGGNLIPYVDRVRAALGIDQQLREPPIAREGRNGLIDGVCVPVSRFPGWAKCPNQNCGALYQRPWYGESDELPRCGRCHRNPTLEQVTWVLVDPAGYLADVPWHYLAHKNSRLPEQINCQVSGKLRLIENGSSRWLLRCDHSDGGCGAEYSFRGDERVGFGVGRMQPWTKDDLVVHREEAAVSHKNLAYVLPINDTRVYSSETNIALVIPPESRVRKGTAVDRLYRNSQERRRIDNAKTPLARKGAIREIATRFRCTPADIENALGDIAAGYPLYGAVFTPGQLRESEYDAFLETLPDQQPDEDLVTINQTREWESMGEAKSTTNGGQTLISGVRNLVRVDRLKAVKVFQGFRRPVESGGGGADQTPCIPPDIVGDSDWLPAIELFGEGIFLTLDEARLVRWEEHPEVVSRLEPLMSRFAQSGHESPNPLSARFLLLHTLSHLLMREIEAEGGYPAASLTEIIYCARAPKAMAGILIYVAVPDIAGSLGGLAELAEPSRFIGILTRALEHAYWCSLDPVCSEHEGQGPGLLNRAACHACALVPDPACQYGNILLDRAFVKGDGVGMPAFFGLGSY
jgi:hypothetical protein